MAKDYKAMQIRAAIFLENEATEQNTAVWIYASRHNLAHALRAFAAAVPDGPNAQQLTNTIWFFCRPLRRAWERGDDAIERMCNTPGDSPEE
jgi:hypothetical protein